MSFSKHLRLMVHKPSTQNIPKPSKTKFLVIILNVIMCRWCYQLLTQTFCPQGRVPKMSTCSLLPLRKIRDWIGNDPDLRENTQQIVEGWDVGGIERSKWSGLLSRSASMDGRKRWGKNAKTMREPLKVHAFFRRSPKGKGSTWVVFFFGWVDWGTVKIFMCNKNSARLPCWHFWSLPGQVAALCPGKLISK